MRNRHTGQRCVLLGLALVCQVAVAAGDMLLAHGHIYTGEPEDALG